MLRAAYIFIYGQHLVYKLGVERRFVVLVVGVAEIVPTRAHEGVERVGVAPRGLAANGANRVHVFFALSQRRRAVGREIHVIGESYGQVFFGHANRAVLGAVYNGYGSAPITLARYRPIAQTVVYLFAAFALLRKIFLYRAYCFERTEPVELSAVFGNAVFAVGEFRIFSVCRLYHALNFEPVFFRKRKIAFVVRGHAHYRARAVCA